MQSVLVSSRDQWCGDLEIHLLYLAIWSMLQAGLLAGAVICICFIIYPPSRPGFQVR
jgi:hypothetical protein